MQDYINFKNKEKEIISRIENSYSEVRKNGLTSNIPEKGFDAGYAVVLRYGNNLMDSIENFSKQVNNSLDGKSLIYNKENLHQTIADYNIKHFEKKFNPNKKILSGLEKSAKNSSNNLDNPVWNSFGKFIYNSNSVILKPLRGINGGTYNLVKKFEENSQKNNLDVRPAWGSHVTVSRFTENISPDKLDNFYGLMENPSFPNESSDGDIFYPSSLVVAFFEMGRDKFNLNITKEFSLR